MKVFATQKTTSFRWLELPVLDQPLMRRASCGAPAPTPWNS